MGFDYSYSFIAYLDIAPYVWVENNQPTAIPETTSVNSAKYSWWREGPTSPDFEHEKVLPHIFDKSNQYISSRKDNEEPFFLYLPLPSPHTPILPTDEFKGKSGLNVYGDFVLMVGSLCRRIKPIFKESGAR